MHPRNYYLQVVPLTEYLVGTGGWAYFKIPGKPSLKAYSEIFNFVEVNYTFYEYPDLRTVERWRRAVPAGFTFSVRCHQDLTHRIGLKPVDEAYYVLGRMVAYCGVLRAPFLVLETPANCIMNREEVGEARDFLSSANFHGVRLVWEVRAPVTAGATELMRDLNVVHCVDLSRQEPTVKSDVLYTRLFGKGQHNLYQFIDEELVDIDQKILKAQPKMAALSYHGIRMNGDAARFLKYKQSGKFLPVTQFTGAESARAVLAEDAEFPASKAELVERQGWKVVDLTIEKRVHLSELLKEIPDRVYSSVDEVVHVLEAKLNE
jgi:uncharacterized protein YecE (DUF72 family)